MSVSTTAISNPYKFSAYRNAALTLSSTPIVVVLDTEDFDTNNNFSTVTGLYTAPVNGFYWFFGQVTWLSITDGQYNWAAIWKNGSELIRGNRGTGQGGNNGAATVGALLQLTAGNTIGLSYGTQSNQSAEAARYATFLHGFLVSQT